MFHSKLFVYWRVVNKVIIIMVTNRCSHKRRSNTKMPWGLRRGIMLVKNFNFTGVYGRIEIHLYFMGAIHQLTSGGTHFIYVNIETPLKGVLSCVTYMCDSWNLWASHLPQSVYGHLKRLAQKHMWIESLNSPFSQQSRANGMQPNKTICSGACGFLTSVGPSSNRLPVGLSTHSEAQAHSSCWISSQKKALVYSPCWQNSKSITEL